MAQIDRSKLVSVLWRGTTLAAFRTACVLLVLAVIVMLVVWQPWVAKVAGSGRTASVTGSATITATPDKYVFSPTYTFTNTDKQAALNAVSAKSDDIVAKLKSLGVASENIKTNASGYDYGYYLPVYGGNNTYTLYLTITVTSVTLAQKVQDYLVTTGPAGQITPAASFSTVRQHELQQQARNQAEQDARSQAEQSARNLGFTIGAVKSVVDSNSGTFPILYGGRNGGGPLAVDSSSSLPIQPGQNDLSYSVQVTYYIQ